MSLLGIAGFWVAELRPGMSVTATVDTKVPAPGASPVRPPVVH